MNTFISAIAATMTANLPPDTSAKPMKNKQTRLYSPHNRGQAITLPAEAELVEYTLGVSDTKPFEVATSDAPHETMSPKKGRRGEYVYLHHCPTGTSTPEAAIPDLLVKTADGKSFKMKLEFVPTETGVRIFTFLAPVEPDPEPGPTPEIIS